jgi:hypothetical protein
MEFKWHMGEVRIDGGEALKWKPATLGDVRGFSSKLERAAAVFRVLEFARTAFEQGRADYSRATEKLNQIMDEANVAAVELVEAAREVYEWFPDLSPKVFAGRGDDLVAFGRGWVDAVREQAETPVEIPEKVETASG